MVAKNKRANNPIITPWSTFADIQSSSTLKSFLTLRLLNNETIAIFTVLSRIRVEIFFLEQYRNSTMMRKLKYKLCRRHRKIHSVSVLFGFDLNFSFMVVKSLIFRYANYYLKI